MKWSVVFCFSFVLLVLYSCHTGKKRQDVDIDDVKVEKVQIHRYGKALFELDHNNLQSELLRIQPRFNIFLKGDLAEVNNVEKIKQFVEDTALINIYSDYLETFPDVSELESALSNSFHYYKYYFPERKVPEIFTYLSGFDFENPVQYYDNCLLIALDMYLGSEYSRYKTLGLPDYVIRKFKRENIVRDCFFEMAKNEINFREVGGTLLDLMINEGKLLWYIEGMDPASPDSVIIKYTTGQIKWAKENESMVWAFLIENEMLFATDLKSYQKLIMDSPFTSYFGDESPARLGLWIGWQIVRSYMEKNAEVSLIGLMQNYDAQLILTQSGYKPTY